MLGLGSIAVFAGLQLGMVLIAFGLRVCRVNCPCKSIRDTFAASAVWSSSLMFIHGTFFEITVCVSISMSMIPFLKYENLLNDADSLSCTFALLFSTIMIAYIAYVFYFLCFKSSKLVDFHRSSVEENNLEQVETFY